MIWLAFLKKSPWWPLRESACFSASAVIPGRVLKSLRHCFIVNQRLICHGPETWRQGASPHVESLCRQLNRFGFVMMRKCPKCKAYVPNRWICQNCQTNMYPLLSWTMVAVLWSLLLYLLLSVFWPEFEFSPDKLRRRRVTEEQRASMNHERRP